MYPNPPCKSSSVLLSNVDFFKNYCLSFFSFWHCFLLLFCSLALVLCIRAKSSLFCHFHWIASVHHSPLSRQDHCSALEYASEILTLIAHFCYFPFPFSISKVFMEQMACLQWKTKFSLGPRDCLFFLLITPLICLRIAYFYFFFLGLYPQNLCWYSYT
jgi:hypothetical protein